MQIIKLNPIPQCMPYVFNVQVCVEINVATVVCANYSFVAVLLCFPKFPQVKIHLYKLHITTKGRSRQEDGNSMDLSIIIYCTVLW